MDKKHLDRIRNQNVRDISLKAVKEKEILMSYSEAYQGEKA